MPEQQTLGAGTQERLGLVLGGGGVAGVAWHVGMLLGLAEGGIDLSGADRIVGTSAGSTVAAQLSGGMDFADMFARQVDPATLVTELKPTVSIADLWAQMAPIYTEAKDAVERRQKLCRLALDADTVDEAVRHRVIAARLAGLDWGDDRVSVVAVETRSGERRVFDRSSGVGLVDAVAASCAVPGIWPPVTIGDDRYVDGGIWSLTNTDLATGCSRVVVLAPIADDVLPVELAGLGAGVVSAVVTPDDASLAAFGTDVLDPAVREASARAGLAQGRAEVDRLAPVLAG
jgi:NTE family protein